MKALDLYINTKRSENTKKFYRIYLTELFKFKNIETIEDFKKLNVDDFYEWRNYLLEKGLSENSIRPKLSAVSKFYDYLIGKPELNINRNIILASDLLKTTKKIVNPEHTSWLDEKESDSLLKHCHNQRELAICAIILNTGIRISELINLKLDKLIFDKDQNGNDVATIVMTRKGGKIQKIYFNHFVTRCIKKYLEIRKETDNKNLFVSNTGNKMSTQSIDRTLKKITNKAGIKKSISAHSLRRTAATNMYNAGYKIDEIQEVLGHSNVATTQLYIKGSQDKAYNVLSSYSVKI